MKKKRLYIIGAGGAGIEIESFLSCIPEDKTDFEIIGYLDDNLAALENIKSDFKILDKISEFKFRKGDYVILSIINIEIKLRIYSLLKDKVRFFSYVDRTSFVGKYSDIGEGTIICPNCLISTNVKIGNFVFVNSGSQIGHSSCVGDFSSIMSNVNIGGECKIADNVFFGTGSIVIPGRRICSKSIVGAGAVVIKDIKTPATYFGNPAVRI